MIIKCFQALPVGVSWAALGTNAIACPQLAPAEVTFVPDRLLPYLARWWCAQAPVALESVWSRLSASIFACMHPPKHYHDEPVGSEPVLTYHHVRLGAYNRTSHGITENQSPAGKKSYIFQIKLYNEHQTIVA